MVVRWEILLAAPTAALLVDKKVASLDDLKADMMVDDSEHLSADAMADWLADATVVVKVEQWVG